MGDELVISKNIKITPEALEALGGILETFQINPQKYPIYVQTTTEFPGPSLMIKTTESDEVFYARREGKSGYSRFVRNRTPHSTNVFTMIIERRDRMAQIIAAYHGYRSHPEPYDSKATKEAIVYWRNHALIPHPIFKIDYTVCKEVSPGRIRIKTSPDRGVALNG